MGHWRSLDDDTNTKRKGGTQAGNPGAAATHEPQFIYFVYFVELASKQAS